MGKELINSISEVRDDVIKCKFIHSLLRKGFKFKIDLKSTILKLFLETSAKILIKIQS